MLSLTKTTGNAYISKNIGIESSVHIVFVMKDSQGESLARQK